MTKRKSTVKRKTTVRKTPIKKRKTKNQSSFSLQKGFQQLTHFTKWTMIVIACLVALLLLIALFERSQQEYYHEDTTSVSVQDKQVFVETIAPISQKLQQKYGVFASVSMAQAMLESNFGKSQLSAEYYNLFGVKTDANDPDGIELPTLEFVNDEWVTMNERFKRYSNWEESLTKHAELIYYGTSWNPDFYKAVLDGKTYQEQAKGLQSAGYATDPTYADKIIAMIEEWQLHQYDTVPETP